MKLQNSKVEKQQKNQQYSDKKEPSNQKIYQDRQLNQNKQQVQQPPTKNFSSQQASSNQKQRQYPEDHKFVPNIKPIQANQPEIQVNKRTQIGEDQQFQERLARLHLREEEKLRRANGLATGYGDSKGPLPVQLVKQLKENINSTNNTKSQDQYYSKRVVVEDFSTQGNFHHEPASHQFHTAQPIEQNLPPRNSSQKNFLFDEEKKYPNPMSELQKIKSEKNEADKQKQKLYKQELDQQINLRKNQVQNFKPYSQQSQKSQNKQDQFQPPYQIIEDQNINNYQSSAMLEIDTDQKNLIQDYDQTSNSFARKMHFSNNVDRSQMEKQKQQQQKYAEELALQVNERARIKAQQQEKEVEQDRIEQLRIQRVLQESKISDDQKIKSQKLKAQEDQAQVQKAMNLKGRRRNFNQDDVQSIQHNQHQNLEKSKQQQPQPQTVIYDTQQYPPTQSLIIPDRVGSQQLNSRDLQHPQVMYENLLDLQQQPIVSIIENRNISSTQMQVHQNYLLQLQQSKHEIEIVKQILEEKLKIQQLEKQNQLMVDQYKNQVKDIKSEQILQDNEIQKLQSIISTNQLKEPSMPKNFTTHSQYINNYSALPSESNKIHSNQGYQNDSLFIKEQSLKPLPFQTLLIHANHSQICEQQQDITQSQQCDDVQLPASSNYVTILNNSMWNNLISNEDKQYMKEFKNGKKQIPDVDVSEEIFLQTSQDKQNDSDYFPDEDEDESELQKGSYLNVDGFDVNMLRTQDYLDMFKQNIQQQPRSSKNTETLKQFNKQKDPPIPQIQQNVKQNSSKFQEQSQDLIYSKNFSTNQYPSSFVSKSIQPKLNYLQGSVLSSVEENYDEPHMSVSSSQLAVSGIIALSQLQKPQELIMSDAKYSNQSIVLPDNDIDESKIINFIESNEADYISPMQGMGKQTNIEPFLDWNSLHKDDMNDQILKYDKKREIDQENNIYTQRAEQNHLQLQKPRTAQNPSSAQQTQSNNYMTGRSDVESVSSKKFKKPKIIDIFSKLDQNATSQQMFMQFMSQKSNQPQAKELDRQQSKLSMNKSQESNQSNENNPNFEVLDTNENLNKSIVSELQIDSYVALPQGNINSQISSIFKGQRSDNIMSRLDNILSQMEQSYEQQSSRPEQIKSSTQTKLQ